MSNLLFICSKNQWRSPTAQLLFKNHTSHTAKSAGTSSKARVKINQNLIDWADVIFVMERKHKDMLKQKYEASMLSQSIIVLNIEDNYQFGNLELIEILKDKLGDYL